jgi:methionyl aminopeptidase
MMMRIKIKNRTEIDKLRAANIIVRDVLSLCGDLIKPGITTWDLEKASREYIEKVGAKSAFYKYQPAKTMQPYPAVLCTSKNEKVVHGIPSKKEVLEEGDILSIDFGVIKNGYCGDAARTFAVGNISETARNLMTTTKASLEAAIKKMLHGNRLSDIGHAVQTVVENDGFNVIRDFVGHGIGQDMHEPPQVPNFGRPGRGLKLQNGLVLAIEPMVTEGDWQVDILEDGWTVVTKDRKLACHFEHSVAITEEGPFVLSA